MKKETISKSEKHHLYREPYDEGRVYLEIKDPEFKTIDNFYGDIHEKKIILTIPKDIWDKLKKDNIE